MVKAPFPYYGGKGKWAEDIWLRFGRADVYVEPFAGSLAVLLANPSPARREVVCDTDGHICNFWRAITLDPEKTAYYADWPTIHQDLKARHIWLIKWASENSFRLSEDADYYDTKAAGWWVWGISNWVGAGWCIPNKKGFSDKRPFVQSHPGGYGVQAQRTDNPDIYAWFQALADRLKEVVVLNTDWTSAITAPMMMDSPSEREKKRVRCVFLDPPYLTDGRCSFIYRSDIEGTSDDAAVVSWQWALKHGDRYRIAYCCHEGDVEVPEGWTYFTGSFAANYVRSVKDAVLFSPACDVPQPTLF